jgi:hypothetical protein
MTWIAAMMLAGGVTMSENVPAAAGDATIAKWRDGKTAAVGLAFDDSLWSQADYVIPLLAGNGLVGSFWVNPGTDRYGYGVEMWEDRAQDLGMELCCHTMNHTGASSFEEADYEIGECARILRGLRAPGAGKFMLFLRGGATEWKITDAQMAELVRKYGLTRGRGGGVDHGGDDKTGEELAGYVKEAESDGEFHCIAFHGVGPYAEWLPAAAPAFEKLVSCLHEARDRIWNGACGEIHRYKKERQSARVKTLEASDKLVRLDLSCDEDPEYYDAALTLDTRVPPGWSGCLVRQGSVESVRPVRDGVVRCEAVPGRGEIVLAPAPKSAAAGAAAVPPRKSAPAGRKPVPVGKPLLTVDRVQDGRTETRELPPGLKDVSAGFSFRLSEDFSMSESARGDRNVLTVLSLTDVQGRPLAAVNVYRQGRELSLFAAMQDNRDWHDIPGSPEIPAGHLSLKAGREHEVILRTRAGQRDGGAELWLDGRLCCSFMHRDTSGRSVKSVSAGLVSEPGGMQGTLRVARVTVTGE